MDSAKADKAETKEKKRMGDKKPNKKNSKKDDKKKTGNKERYIKGK